MGGSTGAQQGLTEVVELAKTDSTPLFGEIPFFLQGAVGALLGNTPILCGGLDWSYHPFNNCISFQNSQWIQSHSIKSINPLGIQINSTTFWLYGGENLFGQAQDSTEFVIQGQTSGVPGPKPPHKYRGRFM